MTHLCYFFPHLRDGGLVGDPEFPGVTNGPDKDSELDRPNNSGYDEAVVKNIIECKTLIVLQLDRFGSVLQPQLPTYSQ